MLGTSIFDRYALAIASALIKSIFGVEAWSGNQPPLPAVV